MSLALRLIKYIRAKRFGLLLNHYQSYSNRINYVKDRK